MSITAIPLDPTNGQSWLTAIFMVLIAPVIEEFVVRGGIHQALITAADRTPESDLRATAGHISNSADIVRENSARNADNKSLWSRLIARPINRLALVAGLFGAMHLPRGLALALAVLPAALLIGWLFERSRSWRGCALAHAAFNAIWIVLALVALPAHADALRGKTLYNSLPPSGGATCASCHGTNPTKNSNKILNGANNPTLITSAISGNTGGMGILKGKWTATDINDIALYLGNPSVSGAAIAGISPATLSFASTIVATAASSQTVTLSNTGNAALSISGLALSGTNGGDFSATGSGACVAGGSLAAGSTCSVSVGFTPQATGTRSAVLTLSHSVGQSTVTLSGTGAAAPQPTVSLNQSLLNFGSVTQGTTSAAQTIVVSNSGTAALSLSGISVSGVAAGVYGLSGTCSVGASVAPGSSCTVIVNFSPAAIATYNGSLQIASNASNGAVSVTLQGSGSAVPAPVLIISPGTLSFGNQTVGGTSSTQVITLQNTGNAAATLSAPALSGSSMFAIVNANACGTSLAAGSSCGLQLQFSPTLASTQSATLVVGNNAGATLQVSLSGTGVVQPTPSPSLSQAVPVKFTDTTVGQQSTAFSVTAGNSGSASYTITQVAVSGAQLSDFVLGGDCVAGKVVASGTTCAVTVKFAPSAVGLRLARVNLLTDSGATLGFDVEGTGIAVATVSGALSANTLSFDSLVVGNTSPVTRTTLINTGNQTLSISAVNITAPFNLLTDSTTCPAAPFTLAPGLQCDFALRFAPVVAGTASGTLSVTTVAPGPALSASLSGVATDPLAASSTTSSSTATGTPASTGNSTATTSSAATDVASGAPKDSPAAAQNLGAGGCTMSPGGNDASMVILLFGALITGLWRRSFSRPKTKETA